MTRRVRIVGLLCLLVVVLAYAVSEALSVAAEISLPGLHFTRIAKAERITGMVVVAEHIYATEQVGRIVRIHRQTGAREPLVTLPNVVSGGETGLLGIALHPDWPRDDRAFVNFTVKRPKLTTIIASLRLPPTGTANAASLVELLTVDQPYSNHNSGALAFGRDGYLYIGLGDGGSGGDPHNHGQDTSTLLGSILRIDIRTPPYTVPPDNPLINRADARPEIYAWGVRNPWGMHRDRGGDGAIYFADVGQDRFEEVNRLQPGNYGWNLLEGTHGYPKGEPGPGNTIAPLAQYEHGIGYSVTGGVVIRDPRLADLVGTYLFGDFATGVMFGYRDGTMQVLGDTELFPSTFADGPDGQVYVAHYAGDVFRIDPAP